MYILSKSEVSAKAVEKPMGLTEYLRDRIVCTMGKFPLGDMTEHIEAALLHGIDKVDEGRGGARIVDQEQDLRPPELDVGLPWVQQ